MFYFWNCSKKKKSSRLGYLPVSNLPTLDGESVTPDSPSLSPGRSVSRQVHFQFFLQNIHFITTPSSANLFADLLFWLYSLYECWYHMSQLIKNFLFAGDKWETWYFEFPFVRNWNQVCIFCKIVCWAEAENIHFIFCLFKELVLPTNHKICLPYPFL